MRLFVGVELCEDARRAAELTANALRKRLGDLVTARWVPPEHLHITVRFIGQVDDDRAPALMETLGAPIAVPPFEVQLDGAGVFPPSGPPRVIWLGLAEGTQSLAAVHAELNQRLAAFGYEPEQRPFSAHLTLARVKEVRQGASTEVRRTVANFTPPPARCAVAHATLFRSHVSPAGSRYEVVARTQLGR